MFEICFKITEGREDSREEEMRRLALYGSFLDLGDEGRGHKTFL